MKIDAILNSIDMGTMALPEFQRGYVWRGNQVRGFMQSLYRRYPVGSLLTWKTPAEVTKLKGGVTPFGGVVELILDGQQRITSLYGLMRGKPPAFFQGNAKAFTDLYFDLRGETFEFYGPVKMKNDPLWVDLTDLFVKGLGPWIKTLGETESVEAAELPVYIERLNRILQVKEIDLHVEQIVGEDRTVEEVVEVFNRVNSGGTKLSKGDLTLARICAGWPEARQRMNERREGWLAHGYDFSLDWYLRVVNAVTNGAAKFSALENIDRADFEKGLAKADKAVDNLLNLVSGRLGLDHNRVLMGRGALPAMARYLELNGGALPADADQQRLLFWYVHASLWGRHSGSLETVLQQDLEALARGGLDELLAVLELWRGDLRVRPEHLVGAGRILRAYPLLYLLSRVGGARDLCGGIELHKGLLGKLAGLELHHIFPKARLKKHGYRERDWNALANFCFLTKECNLAISDRLPEEYLPEYERKHPGVLASQWVPDDPDLWKLENYPKFLERRRELIAAAANDFLDGLRLGTGKVPSEGTDGIGSGIAAVAVPDKEAQELDRLVALVRGVGLGAPEMPYEVVDEVSGEVLAAADAAWPRGMQEELSDPVAFLLEADEEMESRLGELGYRFFTDAGRLVQYVEQLVGQDLDDDGFVGVDGEEELSVREGGSGDDRRDGAADPEVHATSAELLAFAEQQSPPHDAAYRVAFLRRCVDEVGLSMWRPSHGTARYLNLGPGHAGTQPRVAALQPSSGRAAIFIDPGVAERFTNAEVVKHNGEPVYLKVYLTSESAVDDAVALTRLALEARGIEVPAAGAVGSAEAASGGADVS